MEFFMAGARIQGKAAEESSDEASETESIDASENEEEIEILDDTDLVMDEMEEDMPANSSTSTCQQQADRNNAASETIEVPE